MGTCEFWMSEFGSADGKVKSKPVGQVSLTANRRITVSINLNDMENISTMGGVARFSGEFKDFTKKVLSRDDQTATLFQIMPTVKRLEECPHCGSPLISLLATGTGERYRACANLKGRCKWNDRSY
jgi:hypothetical protein